MLRETVSQQAAVIDRMGRDVLALGQPLRESFAARGELTQRVTTLKQMLSDTRASPSSPPSVTSETKFSIPDEWDGGDGKCIKMINSSTMEEHV